jgi:protein O-GlcNAc transferase
MKKKKAPQRQLPVKKSRPAGAPAVGAPAAGGRPQPPAEAVRAFGAALAAHNQGLTDQAEAGYRETLRLWPKHAHAHNNLAILLKRSGRAAEAAVHYAESVGIDPTDIQVRSNMATLFAEIGRDEEATVVLQRALALGPDYPDGWFNLGNCLRNISRKEAAERVYDRALRLRPNMAEAMVNKGELLREKAMLAEAERCYVAALALRPDLSAVFNNLGETLKEQGRLDDAIAVFHKGLEMHPDEQAMHSNLLFILNYNPAVSPDLAWRVHRRWGQMHADPLGRGTRPFANDRSPHRRLRIGYVSPDFCTHSCAYFSEPLIAAHDRSVVELHLYPTSRRFDSATRRFQAMADKWTPLTGMSDADAAATIEADRIDILVDLCGHTCDNRLLTFARKPAPVQVAWLGYPNTTGMQAMDYRFTDAVADPVGAADMRHSERLERLPGGFLSFRPVIDPGPPAPAPCGADGPITFGSFNNTSKVTPAVVKLWSEILRRTPGSRLIVKSRQLGDEATRRRLAEAFAAEGVEPDRTILLPRIDAVTNHLRAYDMVDVALDPFPYNGTTTTCEALWMGVPVVTLAGESHVGRVGASILSHCGLSELVATSPEAYVATAVALADDRARLSALRAGMRARVLGASLSDYQGFARNVEAAYRAMWLSWLKRTGE